MKKPIWIILITLFLDQALKIWVKTHMFLGQEYKILDWFYIHFTENNGMAFGMELGGDWGKLTLSLFRIVFVAFIVVYLIKLVNKKADQILISSLSLVLAGAIGNIIDGVAYGALFSDSYHQTASFLPESGGYAPMFFGKVVDMFYFPMFKGYLPEWLPYWGGEYAVFFRPVFNIADAAISIGVGIMILFQKRIMKEID
ncbi:lipoprotein signal peptidase [Flavobacteriales bacterium]|nr:lipoprotein signal peptidase [Flavobacteriales bacterium]MDG1146601.1 lipoprotein signal peptidase [Flavobacteriales bacterium]MDG1396352.1 lipoprotein signal peptidase [Flavobacteriales bacterium]